MALLVIVALLLVANYVACFLYLFKDIVGTWRPEGGDLIFCVIAAAFLAAMWQLFFPFQQAFLGIGRLALRITSR